MKLFELNEHYEVELNKAWVAMVPEFQELIKRDKGSKGDYRGSLKLQARRELSYIYFMTDFHSPIRDFEDEKKHLEALKFARLEPKDIDAKVKEALVVYENMQYENAPSLRTLNALKMGMANLDRYFKEVDFDKTDKQGKLKYTPEGYIANITKLPKMRTAIKEFELMVEAELKENTGIRGKATLGGMEGKRDKVWKEGGPEEEPRETIEVN